MYHYKFYIFFLSVIYILYLLISPTKNNNHKQQFIEEIINQHAYFLNESQKKKLRKSISFSGHFFQSIDDLYLGHLLNNNKNNISQYYLTAKAFMTSYLDETPNCLRIVNESRSLQKCGYIYYFPTQKNIKIKISSVNKLKIILAGILFHNISSENKLELPSSDLILLENLSEHCNINDITNDIYPIIHKNKNKLTISSDMLVKNKTILYSSLPIFNFCSINSKKMLYFN